MIDHLPKSHLSENGWEQKVIAWMLFSVYLINQGLRLAL